MNLAGHLIGLRSTTAVDIDLFYTTPRLKTVIVPMEELASFKALLSTHQPFTPREPLIFRGAVSVWDALPYAFPDKAFADSALQANLQQGINTGDTNAHSKAAGRGEAPTPLASADRHLLPPTDMPVVDRQQGMARRELVNVAVQCDIIGDAAVALRRSDRKRRRDL